MISLANRVSVPDLTLTIYSPDVSDPTGICQEYIPGGRTSSTGVLQKGMPGIPVIIGKIHISDPVAPVVHSARPVNGHLRAEIHDEPVIRVIQGKIKVAVGR